MWIPKPGKNEWHIYVSVDQTVIGLDKGMSPIQCQAIIWANDDILSIRP